MPRIRSIKPELPHSESMGRISREARLTFILMFTIADDFGKLRGQRRYLAGALYPYDDDAPLKMEKWLHELQNEDCVICYEIKGYHYIKIINWQNHQKISHPTPSRIPEPPANSGELRNSSDVFRNSSDEDRKLSDQGQKPVKGKKSKKGEKPVDNLNGANIQHEQVTDNIDFRKTSEEFRKTSENFRLDKDQGVSIEKKNPPEGGKKKILVEELSAEIIAIELGGWTEKNIPATVNIHRELEKFKAYAKNRPPYPDPVSEFSRWLLRAADFREIDAAKAASGPAPSQDEIDEHNRQLAARMGGSDA